MFFEVSKVLLLLKLFWFDKYVLLFHSYYVYLCLLCFLDTQNRLLGLFFGFLLALCILLYFPFHIKVLLSFAHLYLFSNRC